jgi:hypothetical protein
MALLGTAVLCVWNDVDSSVEDDYNDWCRLEHIPERLSVPGLLRARRYKAIEGSPRYMALYEAASIDVLTSGAYRSQLANPTVWTRRIMPGFRLMQRGIRSIVASDGTGTGQVAVIAHLRPPVDADSAMPGWAREVVSSLLAVKTIEGAHVWAVAPGAASKPHNGTDRSPCHRTTGAVGRHGGSRRHQGSRPG